MVIDQITLATNRNYRWPPERLPLWISFSRTRRTKG